MPSHKMKIFFGDSLNGFWIGNIVTSGNSQSGRIFVSPTEELFGNFTSENLSH